MHFNAPLIDLNLDKLLYCQFIISLDKHDGSFNTLNVPSGNIYVPNKLEHVYLEVFNMIKRIKESKTLLKHISLNVDYNFIIENATQKTWNNDKFQCEYKKNDKTSRI